MTQRRITDDLPALLAVLPSKYEEQVKQANNADDLLEIILDLGRLPMARYVDREVEISDHEVTRSEIDEVLERMGIRRGQPRRHRTYPAPNFSYTQ
jgi:stage III sporulation protein SpoIIIAA